ncbi:class F sortase [Micromonospora sp. M12]
MTAGPDPSIRRHRDRRPLAALVAAGGGLPGRRHRRRAGHHQLAATAGGELAPRLRRRLSVGGRHARAAGSSTRPVRIPRIDVDAALTVLGLDGTGALIPPSDFDTAGWYGGGPAPGDTGPAVLAGHLDSRRGRRCSLGSVSCGPATGLRCGVAGSGWRSG